MARSFARIKSTVWTDDRDWRALQPELQWAYVMLVSQPQINNCGVLPYVPARWARYAVGLTADTLRRILHGLDERRFIVFDEHTAEVLVRSFVKHDEIHRQPNLVKAAQRQYDEIESLRIRQTLAVTYPALFALRPHEEGLPEPLWHGDTKPLPKDLPEPLSKDLSTVHVSSNEEIAQEPLNQAEGEGAREGVNARAREGLQDPGLLEQPLALNQQTAPDDHATAAAHDEHVQTTDLRAAGWSTSQIDRAQHDLPRAIALLEQAIADPACQSPGALAWSKFTAGDQPSPPQRQTVAPGAQGPRSTRGSIDLEAACRNVIHGHSWDADTDEQSIRDEFETKARKTGAELTNGTLTALIGEWHDERDRRYPGDDDDEPPVGQSHPSGARAESAHAKTGAGGEDS